VFRSSEIKRAPKGPFLPDTLNTCDVCGELLLGQLLRALDQIAPRPEIEAGRSVHMSRRRTEKPPTRRKASAGW
jgi:hypothetical protein